MSEAPVDNIFGMILAGKLPSTEVFSDSHVYCFLDLYPQNPGHTLVIPRTYSENIHTANETDVIMCLRTVRKLIPALMNATGADGVTVITNLGRDAGQLVEYLHFHIVPRFKGDAISMYELGDEQTPEQLAAMAQKIKAEL